MFFCCCGLLRFSRDWQPHFARLCGRMAPRVLRGTPPEFRVGSAAPFPARIFARLLRECFLLCIALRGAGISNFARGAGRVKARVILACASCAARRAFVAGSYFARKAEQYFFICAVRFPLCIFRAFARLFNLCLFQKAVSRSIDNGAGVLNFTAGAGRVKARVILACASCAARCVFAVRSYFARKARGFFASAVCALRCARRRRRALAFAALSGFRVCCIFAFAETSRQILRAADTALPVVGALALSGRDALLRWLKYSCPLPLLRR